MRGVSLNGKMEWHKQHLIDIATTCLEPKIIIYREIIFFPLTSKAKEAGVSSLIN